MRQETIKTLEEKAGKDLSDLSRSNLLLDTSPKARAKRLLFDSVEVTDFFSPSSIKQKKRSL